MFYIILTAVLWSFLGLLSKICLLSGMHPLQCALMRSFFGCTIFFLHCAFFHKLKIKIYDICLLILFGAWGIGVYYSCAQFTILLSGAAMDIILQYTAPFWVAIFAHFLFKEYLTRKQIWALCLAAIGTLCVCLSGGSLPKNASVLGIVTGLVSGLCYATHFPVTRFWQKCYDSSTIFFWMLVGGTIALLIVTMTQTSVRFDWPWTVYTASCTMGVVCTYCAFLCYGCALKKIGLVEAAIATEIEPLLSMFWVWFFFDEAFSVIGWVGSVLILLALLLLVLRIKPKYSQS